MAGDTDLENSPDARVPPTVALEVSSSSSPNRDFLGVPVAGAAGLDGVVDVLEKIFKEGQESDNNRFEKKRQRTALKSSSSSSSKREDFFGAAAAGDAAAGLVAVAL